MNRPQKVLDLGTNDEDNILVSYNLQLLGGGGGWWDCVLKSMDGGLPLILAILLIVGGGFTGVLREYVVQVEIWVQLWVGGDHP